MCCFFDYEKAFYKIWKGGSLVQNGEDGYTITLHKIYQTVPHWKKNEGPDQWCGY